MLNKKTTLLTLFSTIAVMSLFSIGRTPISPLNAEGDPYIPDISKVTFTVTRLQSSMDLDVNRTTFAQRSIESYASSQRLSSKDETQKFVWQSASSRLNTTDGTFIALDSGINNAWNVLEATGKLSNRVNSAGTPITSRPSNPFYLTGITMNVAKRTPLQSDIDNNVPVTIELEKTSVTKTTEIFENEETGESDTSTSYAVASLSPVEKWSLTTDGADTGTSYTPTVRLIGETALSNNLVTLTQTFDYAEQISTYRILTSHQTYFQSLTFEYSIDYGDC